MLHWLICVGCQRPTSKVFNFKNYICIFQCRENYMESTKVQRWCWLVLGDLQPVCHAVPVGVDDLNGDRAKDGLIFSPPCPILLWFSLLLWKVFYIYFFACTSTQTYSWHGPHVVVRGQLSWVCSPFSSCESRELNSDCWAWQQTPFLVELPCQPILFNWVRDVDGGMIYVCIHMYVYIFMHLYIVCVYFIRVHCMYIIYVYCIVLAVEPEQQPWAIWKQRGTADFQ